MTIELLSLGGFTLSIAGLTAALDEQSPRLDKTRWWCLALTGSLLWIGLIGHVPGWATVLSCLAFLISLIAVTLAGFAEREAAERETAGEEPAWWPKFERDFQNYARHAAREQRDDPHRR